MFDIVVCKQATSSFNFFAVMHFKFTNQFANRDLRIRFEIKNNKLIDQTI